MASPVVGGLGRVGVPLWAGGSPSQLSSGTSASEYVHSPRHGLHVPRINAASGSAQVVDYQAGGDFPHQHLVGDSMGAGPSLGASYAELSVALSVSRSRPKPALAGACLVDLCPKSFLCLSVHGHNPHLSSKYFPSFAMTSASSGNRTDVAPPTCPTVTPLSTPTRPSSTSI